MYVVNKFAILIFRKRNEYTDNVDESFKNYTTRSLNLEGTSINVIFQNDQGIYEDNNKFVLIDGVFFCGELSDLISEFDSEEFFKNFDHQGVIVILDKTKKVIYAMRDPFGSRTLFFSSIKDLIVVSNDYSLMNNILHKFNVERNLDILTIYEFLALGTIKSRRTLIKNIKQMYPGEYLEIFPIEWKMRITRYYEPWRLESRTEHDPHLILQVFEFLKRRINDFCYASERYTIYYGRRRIAAPISGGLDTTLLLELTSRNYVCRKILFPIHINIVNEYELKLAREVSRKLHLTPQYVTYNYEMLVSNYFVELEKLLKELGYPRKGDAALPYILVGEWCNKKGLTILMSGDGGDGFFGGYDSYVGFLIDLLNKCRLKETIMYIKTLTLQGGISISQVVRDILKGFLLRFYPLRISMLRRKINKLLYNAPKKLKTKILEYLLYYDALVDVLASSSSSYKKFLLEYAMFELPQLLNTNVKAVGSYGVSAVFPFISRRIFELLFDLPDHLFFLPYGPRSLQRVFLKHSGFSQRVYLQKKSGFSMTSLILNNDTILDNISKRLKNSKLSRFIKVDKLGGLDLLNAYNVHVLIEILNI